MPIVEPDEDEAFVGIVPREPNWAQRAIERRGPPPGNAETLIRGGAGWVFGLVPREEPVQAAIVREKREAPKSGDVSLALAREMAWRWFNGRPPFVHVTGSKEPGVTKMARNFVRYAEAEAGFLGQALHAIPKVVAKKFSGDVVPPVDSKVHGACTIESKCCSEGCLACQEA